VLQGEPVHSFGPAEYTASKKKREESQGFSPRFCHTVARHAGGPLVALGADYDE
jgi:hypothetical protein